MQKQSVSVATRANFEINHGGIEESNKDQKFNFGRCKVCKDKATGIHYGIPSCEGCKGFYKRSIDKHEKYVCYFGAKCTITPRQRRRCKLCRWKSCVEAGMSFDSIKMGRISRARKEKVKEIIDIDISPDINSNGKTLKEHIEIQKEALKVMNPIQMRLTQELLDKCYLAYVEFSKDMVEIYQRAIDCLRTNKPEPLQADRIDQTTVQFILKKMLYKMSEDTKHIVLYIKSLPGFSELDIGDLEKLFQEHAGMLLGLKITRSFIEGEVFVMITHNIRMTRGLVARIMGATVEQKIFKFHERFNRLGLNDHEMSLLMPITMTFLPDNLVLKFPHKVMALHEQYKIALMQVLKTSNRTDEFIQEFIETMKSAPSRQNMEEIDR